ncbi:unnamed protein product [Cylindrotheca closterium]|uniref:Uncharacterized protein n=1 Tax=Cylindrotheca closterium TaxID=2856 RepID=A0AAD2JK41_9STRA|nr:unnamed protein product [Cylindrotheca closterium]
MRIRVKYGSSSSRNKKRKNNDGLAKFLLPLLSIITMIAIMSSFPGSTSSFYILTDGIIANKQLNPYIRNLTLDLQSCSNGWCVDTEFRTPRYAAAGPSVAPLLLPQTVHAVPRYTHQGFEKCFANKVVVVIGDSRLRYQFLNLAAFVKYSKFMKCQDYHGGQAEVERVDESCFLIDRESSISNTEESIDWTLWYQETTLELQEGSKQQSLCDCFRHNPFAVRNVYENRYIQRSTDFGTIHLVYLQTFANLVRIDQKFPPYDSYAPRESRCKVGECGVGNRTNAFEGTVEKTLWEVVPKLNATHAFVSMGWEDNWEKISDLACVIRDFQQFYPNIRVFLTINPPIRANLTRDFDDLKCKVDIYDRDTMSKNVPTNWYWDDTHALSILNEEYNHQMMEKVCPIV